MVCLHGRFCCAQAFQLGEMFCHKQYRYTQMVSVLNDFTYALLTHYMHVWNLCLDRDINLTEGVMRTKKSRWPQFTYSINLMVQNA